MVRFILGVLSIWVLSGCALDREYRLRAELSEWLRLGETQFFASRLSCTVGVFAYSGTRPGRGPPHAQRIGAALDRIRAGQAVRFDLPGQSPNAISEAVMSRDLGRGLGLLSSGVGPMRDCMTERIARGYYRVILSEQSQMAYDPGGNALIVLYPPEKLVFFLRGNV